MMFCKYSLAKYNLIANVCVEHVCISCNQTLFLVLLGLENLLYNEMSLIILNIKARIVIIIFVEIHCPRNSFQQFSDTKYTEICRKIVKGCFQEPPVTKFYSFIIFKVSLDRVQTQVKN